MRGLSSLISGFLVLVFLAAPVYAQEETLTIDNYINDHAEIVDDDTERELNALGKQFEHETGAQVVFITEQSLHGQDIRQITYRTFKKYQLGNAQLDNGVLFVVSLEDRERYMEVGRGLEGVLTDITSQHLQTDYLVPYFQKEDYTEGINELYRQTIQTIQNGIDDGSLSASSPDSEKTSDQIAWGMLIPIGLILIATIVLAFRKRYRPGSTLYMEPGQTVTLDVQGYDFEHDNILLSSQDPSIVKAEFGGKIHALQNGKTKIRLQNTTRRTGCTLSVIVMSNRGQRHVDDNRMLEAMLWGSLLSGSRKHRHYGSGGFTGGFGSGGFTGGGGSSRGGGAGGSW